VPLGGWCRLAGVSLRGRGSPVEDWDCVEAVGGYLEAAAGSSVEVVALGVDAVEELEELGLGRFAVHQEVGEVGDGEVPIVRRADGRVVAKQEDCLDGNRARTSRTWASKGAAAVTSSGSDRGPNPRAAAIRWHTRVWRLTAAAYSEYASTRRASQRTSCDRFRLLRSVKAPPP
jgi:hypothetical protein